MFKNRGSTTVLAIVSCIVCVVLGILYGLNYNKAQDGAPAVAGQAPVSGDIQPSSGVAQPAHAPLKPGDASFSSSNSPKRIYRTRVHEAPPASFVQASPRSAAGTPADASMKRRSGNVASESITGSASFAVPFSDPTPAGSLVKRD